MTERLDWFPMYWQRFIIGTSDMTAEEIGAYVLLLIRQWDKGFIPEDPKELKKISRVSNKKLEKVLEKFQKVENNPEKLFNDTLEIIRAEQLEKHQNNSDKGKKGANARWHRHNPGIAQVLPTHDLGNGNRGEENRKEEKRGESIAPELSFQYMIGTEEILNLEENFKEKYPILLNDLKIKYGDIKVKKWIAEFSTLHKQKTWKDQQDFRHHISNFIRLSSEKEEKLKPASQAKQAFVSSKPKPRDPEPTKEEIEKRNKQADNETIQMLSELYEDFLKGKEINDSFGFYARYLESKGKMNGSLIGVFQKIKEQGITIKQYVDS